MDFPEHGPDHIALALTVFIADDPSFAKMVSLSVLKVFYMMPYDGAADFYGQFYSRMRQFGWNG